MTFHRVNSIFKNPKFCRSCLYWLPLPYSDKRGFGICRDRQANPQFTVEWFEIGITASLDWCEHYDGESIS